MATVQTAPSGAAYVPYAQREGNESIVYFTRDLSPEGIIRAYQRVKGNISGRVAVKLHTGEPHGPNIIPPAWVKASWSGSFQRPPSSRPTPSTTGTATPRSSTAEPWRSTAGRTSPPWTSRTSTAR